MVEYLAQEEYLVKDCLLKMISRLIGGQDSKTSENGFLNAGSSKSVLIGCCFKKLERGEAIYLYNPVNP